MLTRILEPEIMDTDQDVSEYSDIDHRAVNKLFVDELCEAMNINKGIVLDIGTGPAHIPLLMAEMLPEIEIVGIDFAPKMVAHAKQNVNSSRYAGRILICYENATEMNFKDELFDFVICNSLAHHIPDPVSLLREVSRVSKARGGIFIKDLLRPKSIEQVNDLVNKHAKHDTPYQRELFRCSLHAALTEEEVKECIHASGLTGVTFSVTSDRHWQIARMSQLED